MMVVLPGSSKKTWPALGGSTKEHSNDLHKTQVSKSKRKANKSTNHVIAVAKLWRERRENQSMLMRKQSNEIFQPLRSRSSSIIALKVDSSIALSEQSISITFLFNHRNLFYESSDSKFPQISKKLTWFYSSYSTSKVKSRCWMRIDKTFFFAIQGQEAESLINQVQIFKFLRCV